MRCFKLVVKARQRIEAENRKGGADEPSACPFRNRIERLLGEEVLTAIGPVKFETMGKIFLLTFLFIGLADS
jgi:hypothetical protein